MLVVAQPSPPLSGAARVGRQRELLDPDRKARLGELGGEVLGVGHDVDRIGTVGVPAAAGPAAQHLSQQVPAAVAIDAVHAPVADRLLVGGHPAADGLGEAAGEHPQQAENQEGAGVGRRREDGGHQRPLGRKDDLEDLADALVEVELGGALGRVGQVAENAGDPLPEEEAVGVVAGVVDRAERLGPGPGQVADDLAGRLGHRHPEHVESRLADAVMLDVVLELVGPVRDLDQDLPPKALRAAIDDRLEAPLQRLRAVLVEQPRQPAGAHPAGGDLAVEVSRERLGRARVAHDHPV